MSDKKQKIMEAAVKLFSEKGYHATSIQQIADTLGIAKGSLYFYFNSKEDLLVYICKHYMNVFVKEFESVMTDSSKQPSERLALQIILKREQFSNNREFITMFMNERFEVNDEIHQLIIMLKAKMLLTIHHCIIELYGEEVEPFAYDAAIMFNSISDGYLGLTMLNQIKLDMEEISHYLVERLDDIVKGLLTSKLKPIINTQLVEEVSKSYSFEMKLNQEVLDEIQVIRGILDEVNLEPETLKEVQSSLKVLESEFDNDDPQIVLVKGMIALLKNLKINEIKKSITKIESTYLNSNGS